MLSVSTAAYDGYPMPVAFAEIAALGVKRVEPAFIRGYVDFDETAFSDASAARFARLLRDNGLTVQAVSAHINLADPGAGEALARRIGFAAGIGAPVLITNSGPANQRPAILRTIDSAFPLLAESGVRLALENPGHGRRDAFGCAAEGLALVAPFDAAHVGLNYDFGNVWTYSLGVRRPEVDVIPALPRVLHAHLKDIKAEGPDWAFGPLGQGSVGYEAVAAALHRAAPDLPLALELPLRLRRPGRGDPLPTAAPLPLTVINRAVSESLAFWSGADRD